MRSKITLKSRVLITAVFSLLLLVGSAFPQVTPLWQKSQATNSFPSYMSTSNTERGFAYGMIGGNPRLVIASTKGGNKLFQLDANTGDSLISYNTSNVTGGTLAISDVGVSSDGVVFACNLVTTSSAGTPFKIYKWTNTTDTATVVATFTTGSYRLGDKITVEGSTADNSIKIYAVHAAATGTAFVVFTTTDNGASFTGTAVTVTGLNSGTSASIAPVNGGGGYYVKGGGQSVKFVNSSNTLAGFVDANYIPTGGNAIRYFSSGSRKFLLVFLNGNSTTINSSTAFYERAKIFEIIGTDTTGVVVGNTPILGTNANTNGTGDVEVVNNGDGTFKVFVLSTNNGLGAYSFNPVNQNGNLVLGATQDFASYWTPDNWTRKSGQMGTNISYTTAGWVPDDFGNVTTPVNRSAKINVYGVSRYYWLITPTVTLSPGVQHQVEFDIALAKFGNTTWDSLGVDDTVAVVVSTDNGATWPASNVIKRWVYGDSIPTTGTHVVLDLSDFSGDLKIGFYGVSTISNKDNDIFIDNFQVRATPVNPIFSVSPESKDYGNIQFGTSSMPQSFTVSNIGAGTLTINSVTLTGADVTSFALTDTNTYPKTLGANQSITFSAVFAPADTGVKNAAIRIVSSPVEVDHDVPLTGRGVDYTIRTFPYAEGFEGGVVPPGGWLNPGNYWNRGTEAHSGSYAARVAYNFSPTAQAILQTPPINLPSRSRVKFWWKDDDITVGKSIGGGEYQPEIIGHDTTFFEISTDGGATWITLDTLSAASPMTAYAEETHDLTPYAGAGRLLRWRDKTDALTAAYGVGLDDISIEEVLPTVTLWQRSAATSTLPSWFSSTGNTERGLAYGKVGSNDRLYVVSRNAGLFVRILDATTGADVDTLKVTGISGGTFALNDIEVTLDGKIFAANLTTNVTTSPLKVYMWDNETADPVNVITFTGTEAVRLGDRFTVTGSYSDGTAKLWFASSTTGFGKVYVFSMSGGVFTNTPQVVSLSDNAVGSIASVAPLGNGDFFWKANGQRARKYQASGALIDTISGSVIASGSNSVKFTGRVAQNEYIVLFQYGAGNENARIVEVPFGNLGGSNTYGVTPSLGSNSNSNGAGDIAFKGNPDGTVDVFVLSTNNGLGAYKTTSAVPVELGTFSASVNGQSVNLNWSTITETNNAGFAVERKSQGGEFTQIAFVEGVGNSTEVNKYSYTDNDVEIGTYTYRLKQIDLDGQYNYSNEIEVEVNSPKSFVLEQNYPNPFNPSTIIRYSVPKDGMITLSVFNLLGEKVATLVNGMVKAGSYEVSFDASALAAGIYLYKLESADFSNTRKMMLIK